MLLKELVGKRAWVGAGATDWAAATRAALQAAGATIEAEPDHAHFIVAAPSGAERLLELAAVKRSPLRSAVLVADAAAAQGEAAAIAEVREQGSVTALTRFLARRLAPRVRVNAVLTSGLAHGNDAAAIPELLRRTPMGRLPTPTEVSEIILYLLAGADFVTGSVLTIDGGRLL